MAISSASEPLGARRPWQESLLARGAVGLAILLAAMAIVVVMAQNEVRSPDPAELLLVPAVGLAFGLSGLVAVSLRPDNRTGSMLIATGILWLAAGSWWSQDPVLFSFGHMLQTLYIAGVIIVLLAFPAGRLETRPLRSLAFAAIVVSGPAEVLFLLLGGHAISATCIGCPPFAFEAFNATAVARGVQAVQEGVALCLIAISLAILLGRWRAASGAMRFAIAPVLWTGSAMLVVFGAWVLGQAFSPATSRALDIALDVALIALAVSFLVGIARTRFARSGVADLVLELGDGVTPGGLEAAMARTLRDPTTRIAYWLPEDGRYVDANGNQADLPAEGEGRVVTMIERDGRRVAALVHDPALDDEQLIRSACAAAGLALENERLQADLKARLVEVQASRARIVQAAQEERRRLERDLHDGAQQRLVATGMTLGLAAARAERDPPGARALIVEARESLHVAVEELRELSHGIHPALLSERGLAAALEDLAGRSPIPIELDLELGGRLPRVAETAAYFVVSEAVTNAAKHSGASRVSVRVRRDAGMVRLRIADTGSGGADVAMGSGLRGLGDRVEGLGGRLTVDSPPGAGTTVEAEIPCA